MTEYRQLPACNEFFPAESISGHYPLTYDIVSVLYSFPLEILREPCLYDYDSTSAELYRFIWIPSFHPTVVATIYADGDYCHAWGNTVDWQFDSYIPSEAKLEVKSLKVGAEVDVDLGAEDCHSIREALARADFWNAPVRISRDVGTDGARFIIQAVKTQQYHFTDRRNPSPEYRATFEQVLKLTGFYRDYFDHY